jgi:hypothetical protein
MGGSFSNVQTVHGHYADVVKCLEMPGRGMEAVHQSCTLAWVSRKEDGARSQSSSRSQQRQGRHQPGCR